MPYSWTHGVISSTEAPPSLMILGCDKLTQKTALMTPPNETPSAPRPYLLIFVNFAPSRNQTLIYIYIYILGHSYHHTHFTVRDELATMEFCPMWYHINFSVYVYAILFSNFLVYKNIFHYLLGLTQTVTL